MREILFRGKRIDSGEWIYGVPLIQEKYKYAAIILWDDSLSEFTEYDAIPETVGQYTDVTDKNGKRIFEGDILKSTKAWYTVEFASGGYGLKPFGKGKIIPIMGHWNFKESEVEVIGNIHDNPELLEGAK